MNLATPTRATGPRRYPLPALPEDWNPERVADIFAPPEDADPFQKIQGELTRDLLCAVFARVKKDSPARTHADLAARARAYVEGDLAQLREVVAQESPDPEIVLLLSDRVAATFRCQMFWALAGY